MRFCLSNSFLYAFFFALVSFLFMGMGKGILYSQTQSSAETEEESPSMEKSRALLRLPPKDALSLIQKLSPSAAALHLSQIRYIARRRNPDIDRLYFLVRHLESLSATDLAQRRLNNLLWVIAFSLLLFSVFLFYIYMNQRRALEDMKAVLAEKKKERQKKSAQEPIYRGEE